jgi:hypothetical protein
LEEPPGLLLQRSVFPLGEPGIDSFSMRLFESGKCILLYGQCLLETDPFQILGMKYSHTQYSFFMILVTLSAGTFFTWVYLSALAEPPSYDSGPNLAVNSVMLLILYVLESFVSLRVRIDEKYLSIKYGLGLYQKKFILNDITSVEQVRNRWYQGWGIRIWFRPRMWMYTVSGFDAVEIQLKNGNIYRIGTDEPELLTQKLVNFLP